MNWFSKDTHSMELDLANKRIAELEGELAAAHKRVDYLEGALETIDTGMMRYAANMREAINIVLAKGMV